MEEIMREVAARTVLGGRDQPGPDGRSENGSVTVHTAKNGDVTGIDIDPRSAPGVDVARLSADIVQAWRRAQREGYLARQEEMSAELGYRPPQSVTDAIEERFREPAAPRAERPVEQRSAEDDEMAWIFGREQ